MNKRLEKIEKQIRELNLLTDDTLAAMIAAIEFYFEKNNSEIIRMSINEFTNAINQIENTIGAFEWDEDVIARGDDFVKRYWKLINILQNLLN